MLKYNKNGGCPGVAAYTYESRQVRHIVFSDHKVNEWLRNIEHCILFDFHLTLLLYTWKLVQINFMQTNTLYQSYLCNYAPISFKPGFQRFTYNHASCNLQLCLVTLGSFMTKYLVFVLTLNKNEFEVISIRKCDTNKWLDLKTAFPVGLLNMSKVWSFPRRAIRAEL